eukprot:13353397-Alexandrium_andersonii.AAC.1
MVTIRVGGEIRGCEIKIGRSPPIRIPRNPQSAQSMAGCWGPRAHSGLRVEWPCKRPRPRSL